jgi:glycosyltransferase involved in cell wall biosynthesis
MTGVSIIIRTRNEAKYLESVLEKISEQEGDFAPEIIIVDSESTDGTLDIATKFRCRVIQLPRSEFTWGRALNMGLEAATNEYCVLLSGHCLPISNRWLPSLIRPLADQSVAAACGGQVPRHGLDPFEEVETLRRFPVIPENTSYQMFTSANSALKRSLWQIYGFSETLNSLEDAELSAKFKRMGYDIKYVAEAAVYHSHPMSLPGVYRRWYWRSRVGMYLRRNTNPRIRRASRSVLPNIVPLQAIMVSTGRYFFSSIKLCITRGYISQLWKIPFYELAREYAIYAGGRDGLLDVKHNEAPARFSYYQNEVPRLINLLRFIEK